MLAAYSPACCFILAPFALFIAHESFLVQFLHPCKTILGKGKKLVPHIPAFLSIKRNRRAWIKVNRLFRSFGYVLAFAISRFLSLILAIACLLRSLSLSVIVFLRPFANFPNSDAIFDVVDC